MDTTAMLSFLAVAATLIVVPGPDWAVLLAAGTSSRAILPTVAGLAVGYVLITGLVAAGVGPVVTAAPAALAALTLVGGAYLLYLGVTIIRAPAATRSSPTEAPLPHGAGAGAWGHLRRGAGVSALNPKSLLFFVAFLPQFARPDAPWPLPVQLAVLGGCWVLLGTFFYSALGLTARTALTSRPAFARTIARVAAAVMILTGAALLGEQALHHLA